MYVCMCVYVCLCINVCIYVCMSLWMYGYHEKLYGYYTDVLYYIKKNYCGYFAKVIFQATKLKFISTNNKFWILDFNTIKSFLHFIDICHMTKNSESLTYFLQQNMYLESVKRFESYQNNILKELGKIEEIS